MARSMDVRLKIGPLKPQWETVKNRNPLLKKSGINTSSLTTSIQKYDTNLTRWKIINDDWWALDKALPPIISAASVIGAQLDALDDQLAKLMAKNQPVVSRAAAELVKLAADANANPQAILNALNDIAGASTDNVTGRASLWNQMDQLSRQKAQLLTKARDDYDTKISAIQKEAIDLSNTVVLMLASSGVRFVERGQLDRRS